MKKINFPKGAPIVLVISVTPTTKSGIGPLPHNEEQVNQLRELDAQRLRNRTDDVVDQMGAVNFERRVAIRTGAVSREDADTGRQPWVNEPREMSLFRRHIEAEGYVLVNINSAVKTSRHGIKSTVVYVKFAIGVAPTSLVTAAASSWLDDVLRAAFKSTTPFVNPMEVDETIVKNATVNLGGRTEDPSAAGNLEFDFYDEASVPMTE